jgi:hypothetical protein
MQFNITDFSLSCLFYGVLYNMYNYVYSFLGTQASYLYYRPISCLPENSQNKMPFSAQKSKNSFFHSLRFLIVVFGTKCIHILLIIIVFLTQKRALGEENLHEAVG